MRNNFWECFVQETMIYLIPHGRMSGFLECISAWIVQSGNLVFVKDNLMLIVEWRESCNQVVWKKFEKSENNIKI